jgi:hypothetical protein
MRVVVGLAVLLALGGCTSGRQRQADPPAVPLVVPVSRVTGQATLDRARAPDPVDGHTCAHGDVAFKLGRQGAWHGDVIQGVLARNISATACTFNPPAISVTDKSGNVMAVKPGDGVVPVSLEPHELANIYVAGQSPPCDGVLNGSDSGIANRLSVGVRTDASTTHFSDAWVSVSCGPPTISSIEDTRITPSTDPLAHLTGKVDAPEQLTPGTVLKYSVTITNPTNEDIALKPCPSYTEGLKGFEGETYQLNCEAATSTPAETSVVFEMQYLVPAEARGDSDLGWILNVRGGAVAGNHVTVGG